MKRKLTVNALAFGNLRKRKKQYALMCIGIILAMVFSSGTLFFLSCMRESTQEIFYRRYGKENILLMNSQSLDMESEAIQGYIQSSGEAHITGYGYLSEEERNDGVAIGWLDEAAAALAYPVVEEGRMPQSAGEIAVERDALARMGLHNKKVGDTMTLQVQIPDGTQYLDKSEKITYTLVGILSDKRRNLSVLSLSGQAELFRLYLPAAYVLEDTQPSPGGREATTCYATVNYVTEDGFSVFYDYLLSQNATAQYYGVTSNFMGRSNSEEAQVTNTTALAAVLAVVLTVVSCLGIVNAFQTNLRQRRTQIGLLRAVGATKRQIIQLYGREAFLLSLICAPVSIAISYFGSYLIIRLLGDSFLFRPKIWILLVCAVVGVGCVMAAALIPLSSAAKISPMQAIRNIDWTRKMVRKKIHSQTSYRLPNLLAKRQLLFHRGKQALVSVILIIAICLSCFGFSWIRQTGENLWTSLYDYEVEIPSDFYGNPVNVLSQSVGLSENDLQELYDTGYVKNIYARKECTVQMLLEEPSAYAALSSTSNGIRMWDILSDPDNADGWSPENATLSEEYEAFRSHCGYEQYPMAMGMRAADDDMLSLLEEGVVEGEINLSKLNSGEEVILYAPKQVALELGTTEYGNYISTVRTLSEDEEYLVVADCPFHAGDTLPLSHLSTEEAWADDNAYPDEVDLLPEDFTRTDHTVTIGAIIHELPDAVVNQGGSSWFDATVITSFPGFQTLTGTDRYRYNNACIYLNQTCTEEIDDYMQSTLERLTSGISNTYLYSRFAFNAEQKMQTRSMVTALLAVVILAFAICGSMINNALTSRIREGKREIGTLRAVGASAGELNRSYVLQFLSLFGWGAGIGFGLYTVLYGILWAVLQSQGMSLELPFAIWECLVVCLVLFLVCVINLRIKIRQQMKTSIIENIREL